MKSEKKKLKTLLSETKTKIKNKKATKKPTKRKIKKSHMEPAILETLFVIINKGKGDLVAQLLNKMKVELQVLSCGNGTASSSMASLFGLGSLEKEIVIAVIKLRDSEKILKTLNDNLQLEEKHYGIAFTIPIQSATTDMLEEVGYYF